MKLPWRREKPTTESPVQFVDLNTWNEIHADSITPVSRPDSLGPLDHSIPFTGPDQADLRLRVTQYVADLHARGALDAGHAAVLDPLIDRLLAEWLLLVDKEAEARRRVTLQLLTVDQANVRAEGVALGEAQRELTRLRKEYAYWAGILGGGVQSLPDYSALEPAKPAEPLLPEFLPQSLIDTSTYTSD